MNKLTDTQSFLLSTASRRDNGSVLPLPTGLMPGGGISRALSALRRHGLIEERPTSDRDAVYRIDGDLRYALYLTSDGERAIGLEPNESIATDIGGAAERAPSPVAQSIAATAPERTTKVTMVLGLLTRTNGATPPELIEATGWLPHTTRAALTGLRKKGHDIARTKRDGVTCYRIAEAAR